MKSSKSKVRVNVHKIPELRFEDQQLTSFAGLVVFQTLFQSIDFKARLRVCFAHLEVAPCFGHHYVTMLLVVHLLMGFRRLRDRDYYHDDPVVRRVLGLRQIPDVSTITRTLKSADQRAVENLRDLNRSMVLDRLSSEGLNLVTLDFDGSVQSTMTRAEGAAVGYNKKKKGARSYYPLLSTVAQTTQILDMHHRSGNVHDSNGSTEFMFDTITMVQATLPGARIEARMDSAFFQDDRLMMLNDLGVEFTASVPFERFNELKGMIQGRERWRRLDNTWSYFELMWKPKCWEREFRFIFIRQSVKDQQKGPLQLDLFVPIEMEFQYKVIVTNKATTAKNVLMFHNGRGAQEAIFAQAKSGMQFDYIPTKSLIANQLYSWSSILAHNLNSELQMRYKTPDRNTTRKRSPLWIFQSISTLRQRLLQRAGRLSRPEGRLTLTMSGNQSVRDELLGLVQAAQAA